MIVWGFNASQSYSTSYGRSAEVRVLHTDYQERKQRIDRNAAQHEVIGLLIPLQCLSDSRDDVTAVLS